MDNTAQAQLEQNAVQAPDRRSPAAAPWSLAHRIVFRFSCCYLLLYITPSPLDVMPGGSWLANAYSAVWHKLVPWVALHILHLSGTATTYFPTGSGDTTLDYIQILLYVVFAAGVVVIWSLADHRRNDYRWLHSWLRVAVRYTLAFTMLGYGFAKVFPLQFGLGVGFMSLTEPYGDFSSMGVLWKFMGASTVYTFFAGICEVVGGTLLLFRRTTTLGAMVSFGVLLNIVLLNFCYDVPVKLYSSNLMLMAIFLAAPDLRRLLNFLVLNRGSEPADLSSPRFGRRWARISSVLFQVVFLGYFLLSVISQPWALYKQTINEKRPPLYGLYDVESFTRNGQELPPLITDPTRWKKVCIQHPGNLGIRMMDDLPKLYHTEYDVAKNTLALSEGGDRARLKVGKQIEKFSKMRLYKFIHFIIYSGDEEQKVRSTHDTQCRRTPVLTPITL